MSCDRSATLCSSAAERATYCRAPFHAHVCQISPGVVSSPSALVSQQSLLYCSSIFLVKWKTHPSAEEFTLLCWLIVLFDPSHPLCLYVLWNLLLLHCDISLSYLSLFTSLPLQISVTRPFLSLSLFALFNLLVLPSFFLSSSSPPLQPAGATCPVWCASHWTAIPRLHAHLYVPVWLLFGRRIRAQDLQVWWKLDREAPSLCRYQPGCIPPK